MKKHYDLIAIGAGSGGLAVAEKAAEYGKRVAVVEAGAMGGTCVNNGCVPKKVMWYAANLAHAADDANGCGVPTTRGCTDWFRLVGGRDAYIANITQYWDGYVADSGIDRIEGHARFVDERRIEVDGELYTAEHIVIATGGRPVVPPVPGAALGITSDGFLHCANSPGGLRSSTVATSASNWQACCKLSVRRWRWWRSRIACSRPSTPCSVRC